MKNGRIFCLSLVTAASLASCSNGSNDPVASKEMTETELISHGEYLVTIMDCNICHSPKVLNAEMQPMLAPGRELSGHPGDQPLDLSGFDMTKTPIGPWIFAHGNFTAYAGPWGISYAANITPDPSGIGNMSFEDFKRSFQQGKYKGGPDGRPLMPPMPWESFAHLPEQDVLAIYTYLTKKVQPVSNIPPAYTPPAGPPPGVGPPM